MRLGSFLTFSSTVSFDTKACAFVKASAQFPLPVMLAVRMSCVSFAALSRNRDVEGS